MFEHYLNWFNLAVEALKYNVVNAKSYEGIEKVIVVGMGGSGIVGDMLAVIAQDYSSTPVYVYKDFYIPRNAITKNTFVLAVSYSGNTLETITSVLQAIKANTPIGVVASDGELIEIAKKFELPYIVVKQGLAPRSAFPLLLLASIKLLQDCSILPLPMNVIESAVEKLRDTSKADAEASKLTEFLLNVKLPTIVSTTRFSPLAIRIKNELNENAKMPAKVEIVPELFHNDIVGWERFGHGERAIVIDSDIDYENLLLDFYADYLKSAGFEVFHLRLEGTIIERFLVGSLIAGLASVKIATKLGFDPLQTKSIVAYKNFLKNYREKIVETLTKGRFPS